MQGRRELEFKQCPEWKAGWKKIQKRDLKKSHDEQMRLSFERTFLRQMITRFEETLLSLKTDEHVPEEELRYCERFMELLIDLENLLPTRRFFNTVLDDSQIIVRCSLSELVRRPEGKLFGQVST
jgi:intron-binding protein aquarius